jgi:hypothetical protein
MCEYYRILWKGHEHPQTLIFTGCPGITDNYLSKWCGCTTETLWKQVVGWLVGCLRQLHSRLALLALL